MLYYFAERKWTKIGRQLLDARRRTRRSRRGGGQGDEGFDDEQGPKARRRAGADEGFDDNEGRRERGAEEDEETRASTIMRAGAEEKQSRRGCDADEGDNREMGV
ncbi:hypothetical protein Sjap_004673 [Stephania japonica]|uniref:Uncharacterized protein n=1 Tax=Stephania japonica TaxID=461633 RepID=A0AAP0K3N2_9MAGN